MSPKRQDKLQFKAPKAHLFQTIKNSINFIDNPIDHPAQRPLHAKALS